MKSSFPTTRRAAFSYAIPASVSFFFNTSGSPRFVDTITSVSSGIAPNSGTPSIS